MVITLDNNNWKNVSFKFLTEDAFRFFKFFNIVYPVLTKYTNYTFDIYSIINKKTQDVSLNLHSLLLEFSSNIQKELVNVKNDYNTDFYSLNLSNYSSYSTDCYDVTNLHDIPLSSNNRAYKTTFKIDNVEEVYKEVLSTYFKIIANRMLIEAHQHNKKIKKFCILQPNHFYHHSLICKNFEIESTMSIREILQQFVILDHIHYELCYNTNIVDVLLNDNNIIRYGHIETKHEHLVKLLNDHLTDRYCITLPSELQFYSNSSKPLLYLLYEYNDDSEKFYFKDSKEEREID